MENLRYKFREWCKESKQMFYEPYMHEEVSIEEHFNDCGRMFMQYTGLKDKNGVEIYESDLVKLYTESKYLEKEDWRVYEGEVKINNGCWVIFDNKTNQLLYGFGDIEVIGNIYENPELLKDNK